MRLPGSASVAIVALVVLIAAGLSGCSSTLGYAAQINGAVISQSSINQDLADSLANAPYVKAIEGQGGSVQGSGGAGSYSQEYASTVLNEQVEYVIESQVLAAHHALPTAAQLKSAENELKNPPQQSGMSYYSTFPARYQQVLIKDQATNDAFLNYSTADLTSNTFSQYYHAHLSSFTSEWCTRIIVIVDANAAQQVDPAAGLADVQKVKALLDAGGDFAALAKQYSKGTGAAQGGALTGSAADGCLNLSDLQQLAQSSSSLAEAILQAPVGQVSDPIEFQTGEYILFQVTKEVTAALGSSTVTADIRNTLGQQALLKLLLASHVNVNPAFGSYKPSVDANGNFLGVVPPVVPTFGVTTTTTPTPSGT